MRPILLGLCALALGGCSLLLDESDPDPEPDAGSPEVDGGVTAPMACDRAACDVIEMTFDIGVGHDFQTLSAWADARGGNLIDREVIAVADPPDDEYPNGFQLSFGGGCLTGDVVAPSIRASGLLFVSLDNVRAVQECEIGAPAVEVGGFYAGHLGVGTVEIGRAHGDSNSSFIDNVVIDGVTDENAFMWLTADDASRHLGVQGAGVRLTGDATGTEALIVRAPHTRVEWLEIDGWRGTTTSTPGVRIEATGVELHRMIISDSIGTDTGFAPGIRMDVDDNIVATATISNSIIRDTTGACIYINTEVNELTVVNTTIFQCWRSTSDPATFAVELDAGARDAKLLMMNVISLGSGVDSYGPGVSSTDEGDTHSIHDMSSTDPPFSQMSNAGAVFEGSPTDLTLSVTSPAAAIGIPQTQVQFREAIDGRVRPNTGTWTAGAF